MIVGNVLAIKVATLELTTFTSVYYPTLLTWKEVSSFGCLFQRNLLPIPAMSIACRLGTGLAELWSPVGKTRRSTYGQLENQTALW